MFCTPKGVQNDHVQYWSTCLVLHKLDYNGYKKKTTKTNLKMILSLLQEQKKTCGMTHPL